MSSDLSVRNRYSLGRASLPTVAVFTGTNNTTLPGSLTVQGPASITGAVFISGTTSLNAGATLPNAAYFSGKFSELLNDLGTYTATTSTASLTC